MKNFTEERGFIPVFEGNVEVCRRLYDDLIIFERDGSVVGCRTDKTFLRALKNFYDLADSEDAALVNDGCVSFDHKWILIKTKVGCAAVFTGLYAAGGLLIAVIPHFPTEAVRAYFEAFGSPIAVTSGGFDALPCCEISDKVTARIGRGMEIADSALSHQLITAAIYRLGTGIGEFLSERLMEVADLVGCVGEFRSEFLQMPRLEALCPEVLISTSLCLTLFARNSSTDRRLKAFIGEHKGHVTVSFSVNVGEKYKLYDKQGFADRLIAVCEEVAARRDTFFDCSLDGGRLRIVFVPESDPLTTRRIKQDFEGYINGFWGE